MRWGRSQEVWWKENLVTRIMLQKKILEFRPVWYRHTEFSCGSFKICLYQLYSLNCVLSCFKINDNEIGFLSNRASVDDSRGVSRGYHQIWDYMIRYDISRYHMISYYILWYHMMRHHIIIYHTISHGVKRIIW